MVLKACHLHLQQGCVNKGSLNPSSPLALPSPLPPQEEGPSGLPRGGMAELGGHSVQGGEGSDLATAALRTSLVWGYEETGMGKRDGGRGYWRLWPLTGYLSKDHNLRSGIRFLWTQCAQGGRGSRLSSPRHVGGWVCWHPPRTRAPAACAPAADCAGTSLHSSAAAASGTR